MHVVGDLHAYVWSGRDNNCNSYVFARALAGGRHLLIDPGHVTTPSFREAGLARLMDGMRTDGVDPEGIGLVLLTHFHPDHSEGATPLREAGALVGIHEAEADLYRRWGGKVDVLLTEGDLDLGGLEGLRLQILHVPGHSPGHIAIYWPAHKALVAGDLVFFRGTGRVDLPGGDARALGRSLRRVSELDAHYVLCGHPYGHPGVIEGRDEVRANFEALRASVLF
jgi:glyoxylase-like metal-dependent hydrolase (beta-lactamase superfamily II)